MFTEGASKRRCARTFSWSCPPADVGAGGPKQCGKLSKAIYGARHAAVVRQSEVHEATADIGPGSTPNASSGAGRRRVLEEIKEWAWAGAGT